MYSRKSNRLLLGVHVQTARPVHSPYEVERSYLSDKPDDVSRSVDRMSKPKEINVGC